MLYRSDLTIFSIDNQHEKGSEKNAMGWSTTAYFPFTKRKTTDFRWCFPHARDANLDSANSLTSIHSFMDLICSGIRNLITRDDIIVSPPIRKIAY